MNPNSPEIDPQLRPQGNPEMRPEYPPRVSPQPDPQTLAKLGQTALGGAGVQRPAQR